MLAADEATTSAAALAAEGVALAAVLTGAPKVGAAEEPKDRPAVVADAAAAEDWGTLRLPNANPVPGTWVDMSSHVSSQWTGSLPNRQCSKRTDIYMCTWMAQQAHT